MGGQLCNETTPLDMASLPSAPIETDSEKEMNCSLCRQPYRDPRLLPCLHVFCFDCLQKQVDDSTEHQSALVCPTCSEQVPLPVNDLPSHVYLRNQANAVRRVLELKKAGECENCNSEGRCARFVPTVAIVGFVSASSA